MQKQKQNQNNFPAHLVSFCWVRSSKLTQMGLVGHQTCVYQPVYPSRSIARVRDNSQSVDGQAAHRRAAADGACFSPLQKEMTRLGQKGGSTIIFTFSGSGGPIFTFRSVETTVTNLRACAAVVAALPGFRKGGGGERTRHAGSVCLASSRRARRRRGRREQPRLLFVDTVGLLPLPRPDSAATWPCRPAAPARHPGLWTP